jgi:hypothetical protein
MKTNISIYPKAEGDWRGLTGAKRHGENFAGNFGWYKGGYKEFELIHLEEWERDWLRKEGVVLKEDELAFRYETDMTRAGAIRPLVKVNVKRGLIYFLTLSEGVGFDKRGSKVNFLNLVA